MGAQQIMVVVLISKILLGVLAELAPLVRLFIFVVFFYLRCITILSDIIVIIAVITIIIITIIIIILQGSDITIFIQSCNFLPINTHMPYPVVSDNLVIVHDGDNVARLSDSVH